MNPKITPRFSRKESKEFFNTLNKRVNQYFRENNIDKTGNWKLYLKTVVMFMLLVTPFVLILLLDISDWYKLPLAVLVGVGLAGVGMNVMHDGNHGSFSKYHWINKLMGSSIYILAGNVFNWKIQHNVLHHTYTNIKDHDEDLDAGVVLRFSKHADWRPHHRFQHLYSVLLYGLLTLKWAIVTDFIQLTRYQKKNLSYANSKSHSVQWVGLIISKIVYFSVWIILPIFIFHFTWWKVMIGFFVMHYTAGLILSLVFQLAHIIGEADMPLPDLNSGTMKNSWAVHQLRTTVNFSTKNRIVNWFTGGLNHQIEHHIFPHISHVHYTKISRIVKRTAQEFNLPYNEYKTTRSAIFSHFKFLKQMGMQPVYIQ
ncbi:MAG: acyl-CoA desaturase [Flavobacteriaceae bacterium]|nr:acyl-CoA desaturase [Flavobacteriaceae bacterium]|tara:strand:+ start:1264 stop:2370 length:1107 start_codon:yes stop_codon:yes gene_type:complete